MVSSISSLSGLPESEKSSSFLLTLPPPSWWCLWFFFTCFTAPLLASQTSDEHLLRQQPDLLLEPTCHLYWAVGLFTSSMRLWESIGLTHRLHLYTFLYSIHVSLNADLFIFYVYESLPATFLGNGRVLPQYEWLQLVIYRT